MRLRYLSAHPLCEECLKSGRTRAAQEVHHVKPILSGQSEETMRRLAYDPTNLQALCHECHKAKHERQGPMASRENTREKARSDSEDFLKRWTGG